MPNAISAQQRNDINERLAKGEAPLDIAIAVGVGRTTVRRYARKLKDAGGLPALRASQVATLPAARMYIEGDDEAADDLLRLMDLRQQAETMRILEQARSRHADSRSCDVAELYEILQFAATQTKVVMGQDHDDDIRDIWSRVDSHIRARHPKIVDRMSRAGIPL